MKNMLFVIYGLMLLTLSVNISYGEIIRVPQDYPTIQQGIDAAIAGDIVIVASGTYNEEITLKAGVIVKGAGEGLSTINGGGDVGDVVFAAGNDITNDTKFQGFTVTGAISGGSMPGGAGIFCNSGAKPEISNNRVEGNDFGIVTWNQSTAFIHNNVVINNTYSGIGLNTGATVINNTLINNRIGINDGGGYGPAVMDNIVTNHSLYGVYAVGAPPALTYNDVWGNATNYQNCSPGTGSISVDPLFINPPSDVHLQPGSPCIDAGNPAQQYNDPDGSRNDMGAYGGPGSTVSFPIIELTIPFQNEINVIDSTNTSAMFNVDMDASTFTQNTVRLYGSISGVHNGIISYDSAARMVTMNPDDNFQGQEIATVILTGDIMSSVGDSLDGYVWQFTTRVDSGSGIFNMTNLYAAGIEPYYTACGDFNNDGNIDVVCSNNLSDNVTVFLGNGNGTFNTGVGYSTGQQPRTILAQDLDLDGDIDLAVTNSLSNNLSVLIGQGNGTFNAATDYPVGGTGPVGACGGDFNADGYIDLATANTSSDNISVLLGNGDGSFGPATTYSAGVVPSDICAGDINNDGVFDLVAINDQGSIAIFIGDGEGTFAAAVYHTVGSNPSSVGTADLNEDGNLDIVVSRVTANCVTRVLGNGDGTFGSGANFSAGTEPSCLSCSDFDGDGHCDLAVVNLGSDNVSILIGGGNGAFQPAVQYQTGSAPQGVAAADFDNDIDIDLVTADFDADSISILLNESALHVVGTNPGQNELNAPLSTDISATFNIDAQAATINDTTFIVFGVQSGPHPGSIIYSSGTLTATFDPDIDILDGEVVTVLMTKDIRSTLGPYLDGFIWDFTAAVTTSSAGTFSNAQNFASGNEPRGQYAADYDADGDIDIAVTVNPGSIAILFNQGNGTFSAPVYTGVQSDPIALYGADFDADGDVDLASAHNEPGTSHLVILKNDGSGSFSEFATYAPAILGQSVGGGDFDADGDVDLIMTDGWGSGTNVRVMFNNGNGSFTGPITYTAGTWARGVVSKDVDNDGDVDLAISNAGNDNVSVLYNDGSGDYSAIANFATGSNPTAVCGNDLNGDGHVDLATANYSGHDVAVILNNGNGTFQAPALYNTGANTRAIVGGDFDGDSDIDLAVSANNADSVSVLLNNGNGTFQGCVQYHVGLSPWGIQTADYDLDGDLDLSCVNYNSDNLTVLYNTGSGVQENRSIAGIGYMRITPNPFSDRVMIDFHSTGKESVDKDYVISVYDITGRVVRRSSVSVSHNAPWVWDGTDARGRDCANGVYLCEITSENARLTRHVVLIR